MSKNVLDYLLLMIDSGYRFDQAITYLSDLYPNNMRFKQINQKLHLGESEVSVMVYLFPWWLVYPFENLSFVINIKFFLKTYTSYFHVKLNWFNKCFKLLLYPFILLFFSSVILYALIIYFIPISSQYFTHADLNFLENISIIFLFIYLFQFIWFLLVIRYILLFNTLDFLQVLDICFKMRLPLNVILTELTFTKKFNKTWILIIDDTYKNQSFVQSICDHLKLPKIVKRLLYSYNQSEQISQGISLAKKIYQHYFFRSFLIQIKILQFSIYLVIIGIIFVIISQLYLPLRTINTL